MTDLQSQPTRRTMLFGMAAASTALVAGCSTSGDARPSAFARTRTIASRVFDSPRMNYAAIYGPMVDEGYALPAIPFQKIPEQFLRREVDDPTGMGPGNIVVDTNNHFLYFTQPGGRAMRYGVGLGRQGFSWSGSAVVQWKKKWPTWTPPDEMIARQPELVRFSADNGGQPPGLNNPLGARALYIFQGGEDTLYRLHGSPEWFSIGKNVSSGCVRLMNQDIIDLYDRVPNGTPILVTSGLSSV